MTTLDELTNAIEQCQADLRRAIEGAEPYWQSRVLTPEAPEVNPRASGDAWTPQEAADHAIGAIGFFAGMAAAGIGVEVAPPPAPDVASTRSALASLESSIGTCRAVLRAANDLHAADDLHAANEDVLAKPTGLGDRQLSYAASRGHVIDKNVAGALWMAALHGTDHAQQIASGVTRT